MAENLKNKGDGKVWLMATAQQTLTEDDPRAALNSPELFKLQARFPITVDLESRDIKEICYRRLLAKSSSGAALLGDLTEPVEKICERASQQAGLVSPANYNSPAQVVISGEEAGVERAMALAKEAGAKRGIRLNVSGAFHSALMESALGGLSEALATTEFTDPRFPVYANVNAAPVKDASEARRLLIDQLTRPVRWTDEVTAMAQRYPDALYIEMGPGSVLVGLVKKIAPALRTMTCGTAAEVQQLLELASASRWEEFATSFFRDALAVPAEALDALLDDMPDVDSLAAQVQRH